MDIQKAEVVKMNKVCVFCFPHAGGLSHAYRDFQNLNDERLEYCPLDIAGHGKRANEKLCTDFCEIVEDLYIQIRSVLSPNKKFVLMGHSMGAWLAYEMAYKLLKEHDISPMVLVLSSNVPSEYSNENVILDRDEETTIGRLIEKYPNLETCFNDDMLRDFFYPIFVADYKAIDDYLTKDLRGRKVTSNIYGIKGTNDTINTSAFMHWQDYTTGVFFEDELTGDHFALYNHVKYVNEKIKELICFTERWKGKTDDRSSNHENRFSS